MNIGGLVVDNGEKCRTRLARIVPAAPSARDPGGNAGNNMPGLKRRSVDEANENQADRRGVAPEVRSKSTVIIYDQRAVDRREIEDRRRSQNAPAPSSGFVAQAVAREGMLLDLRPDPLETRRARTAYGGAASDEQLDQVNTRIDLTV